MIKKFLLLLIFAMNTYSYNQQNFFGSVGQFYAPTARFNEVGTLSMNVNYSENFSRVNFLAQPYDWLEVSLFYADIPSKPFAASLDQSYKDKGFNLKVKLLDESKHKPELAIGLSDFAGTGLFSGEFFVASKKINNLDVSVGLGWGIYGGFYDFKNPFRLLGSEFDNRNENFDFVGEIDANDFFSGEEASIFGSVSYVLGKSELFYEHLDLTLSKQRFNSIKPSSESHLGYRYKIDDQLSISLIYGNKGDISAQFELNNNFSKVTPNKLRLPAEKKKGGLLNVIEAMQLNDIALKEIFIGDDNNLYIGIRQNKFQNVKNSVNFTSQILNYAGIDQVDEVIVKNYSFGSEIARDKINLKDSNQQPLERKKVLIKNKIYETDEEFPGIITNIFPSFKTFIASRENFLNYGLMLNSVNTIYFQENTFIDTKFSISLANNFDELYLPPVDTYPNQVRSDVKEYYNSIGNKPFVERLEINHLESFGNNYFLFRAGIFESMFAGLGFEYLTVNRFKNIAYGLELFEVKKRDYDQRFSFLDYETTTGHINFYHYLDGLDLTTHVSAGKYLAGDKGITYDFSRRFKNGFKLGFFFSRTDVSKEQFGEGSFDKGIYLSIPIGSPLNEENNSSFFWRPLTKDPAQKLGVNTRLFNIVDRYIY